MNHPPYNRQRGSTYIVVLGSSMVVAVIGLAAITATRMERRSTEGMTDVSTARFYAQSAIELGCYLIGSDANWRTNRVNGTWVSNRVIGTGTLSLLGVDPNDANLSDSPTDPLVLTGIGLEGEARYNLQVWLQAQIPPLACLETAVQAGSGVTFTSATVTCNQIISSNTDTTATASTVTADLEAVGAINGATYVGTQTTGITARKMPSATAFDFYVNNGTAIPFANIPIVTSVATIENAVISPASNPYGATTNAQGIYVINCGGNRLRIHNCRVVGTVVLLNTSTDSEVIDSVAWEPAVANYPALMVSGSIVLAMSNVALSETTIGVNFNPSGTAFEGSVDADTSDVYRSIIEGLVYVSGGATIYNQTTIDGGLIVGGTVTCQAPSGTSAPSFGYRAIYYNNPPPGFTDTPKMILSPGTWKQVVN